MALAKEDFIKEIEKMSVVDLHELVEAIKEKFGVTGAVAAAPVAAGAGGGGAEEKTSFNVILKEVGANKIAVIKEVKALLGLGLKEAKEVAETPDKAIKEGVDKKEAEEIKAKLEAAGAKIELQ